MMHVVLAKYLYEHNITSITIFEIYIQLKHNFIIVLYYTLVKTQRQFHGLLYILRRDVVVLEYIFLCLGVILCRLGTKRMAFRLKNMDCTKQVSVPHSFSITSLKTQKPTRICVSIFLRSNLRVFRFLGS